MPMPKRPARPSDPFAWRDQLIAELESAVKTATGSVQPVLQKLLAVVSNSRPGGSLDRQLFQDLQESFGRFSQDRSAAAPPVIMESLEWIQICFIAPSSASSSSSSSAGAAAKPAGVVKGGKDSFDSGAAQRARSLTGDIPLTPGAPKEKPQEQLESIKNWLMNPGLGKVKG